MIAALVVVGFFVIGWLIGFVFSMLKWVLIIGVLALVAMGLMRLTRSGGAKAKNSDYS
jgi:F0F1-type ATP synthase assembly protein I